MGDSRRRNLDVKREEPSPFGAVDARRTSYLKAGSRGPSGRAMLVKWRSGCSRLPVFRQIPFWSVVIVALLAACLREAGLRNVQDVARLGLNKGWNERRDVREWNVRRGGYDNRDRFDRLSTATARHARWRARAVFTSRLLVGHAWLSPDQG